jgi:serine/threonine protein phosphatase PrpC
MKNYAKLIGGSLVVLGAASIYMRPVKAQSTPTTEPEIVRTEKDGGVSSRYFRFAASNIPHISKKEKGGEDAWVASHNLLVVADGVGGWANEGIDSGLFSKQLVSDIKMIFDANEAQELKSILVESVKMNPNVGSSTCVLAKFDSERNVLKTTNLGDSGYLLLRPDDTGALT